MLNYIRELSVKMKLWIPSLTLYFEAEQE